MTPACQIGALQIGPAPAVVGVVTRRETLARIRRDPPPCDLVELRADMMDDCSPDELAAFDPAAPPRLLTIRLAREGGRWNESEASRVARYRALVPHVHAVDVELESEAFAPVAAAAHEAGRCVVGSFHDFSATPDIERLRALLARGARDGADLVKIATWTTREEEVDRLASLLEAPRAKPLAVMGMGPLGVASRLRLAAAGSCLVYGFLDDATAPGQLSAAEWVERLTETLPAYRAARAHA